MMRRLMIVLLTVLGGASAVPAGAAWVVVPPRPGQVGLSVQGQYGALLKSGSFGDEFSTGPGIAVRLRYRMRYERAMGLSFESQQFDVREASAADTAANHLTAFCYGLDVYQMFGTKTRTSKWLNVGLGLTQFRRELNNGDQQFGLDNDGFYVSVGAGMERFFWQSWALDLSSKYLTVFQDGTANYDFQAAIGVIVYASY